MVAAVARIEAAVAVATAAAVGAATASIYCY